MHGMIGYLPAISAGQVVFEYIETSFFFTQIVEGRTVCRPYRITVFSFKGSYFLEGVFPIEVHNQMSRVMEDWWCLRQGSSYPFLSWYKSLSPFLFKARLSMAREE